MRDFHPPVSERLRGRLIELVDELITICPKLKTHYGRDLAMDDEDLVVSEVARFDLGEEVGKITVARSKPEARPPFEWIVEITSDINLDDTDYLKHYLVRDDDVVLAQRKVLTEVDDAEAELLVRDLEQTLAFAREQ